MSDGISGERLRRPGLTVWEYPEEALAEPTSALIVSAERSLRAEFPSEAQAQVILGEIGSGPSPSPTSLALAAV